MPEIFKGNLGDLDQRGRRGTTVVGDSGGARVPKGPNIPIADTVKFDTRFNSRRGIYNLIQVTTEPIADIKPQKPLTP